MAKYIIQAIKLLSNVYYSMMANRIVNDVLNVLFSHTMTISILLMYYWNVSVILLM